MKTFVFLLVLWCNASAATTKVAKFFARRDYSAGGPPTSAALGHGGFVAVADVNGDKIPDTNRNRWLRPDLDPAGKRGRHLPPGSVVHDGGVPVCWCSY